MKIAADKDPDGNLSAYIIYRACELGILKAKPDFLDVAYGKPFPLDQVSKNEHVFILDFSVELDEMKALLAITPNVHWIDHHVSSIDKYKEIKQNIKGQRDLALATCGNTFQYLFPNKPLPRMVQLVNDFDIWADGFKEEALPFIYGIQTEDILPNSGRWAHIEKNIDHYIELGCKIQSFLSNQNKEKMQKAFAATFEGHKTLVLNSYERGCLAFDEHPDKDQYDILMLYHRNKDGFGFSIYSDTVDVSKLAVKYGGGGHQGAAGFRAEEIPFEQVD